MAVKTPLKTTFETNLETIPIIPQRTLATILYGPFKMELSYILGIQKVACN